MKMNNVTIKVKSITTRVDSLSWSRVGQETFFISATTSLKNFFIFLNIGLNINFAREEGLEPPTDGFGDRNSTN